MSYNATDAAPLVRTEGLTKRYAKALAVDGLNLTVRRGEVYGFLGPNGAGKTTTMRILLGLISPSAGKVSVMGEAPGSPEGLARIGSMVESPAFYPYLSGRANLDLVARLSGVKDPKGSVRQALERVGLSGRSKDKFKKYSLGMKQRLGIGAALLKDPELLILDEPTNGLDPQGMIEVRELIRTIGRGERTVLLSSHLMGEVEQVCERVGIIREGKLVAEGTVAGLRGKGGLLLRAEPLERAAEVVGAIEGVESVEIRDGAVHLIAPPEVAPEVARKLLMSGVSVTELRAEQRSLEDAFLELMGEERV